MFTRRLHRPVLVALAASALTLSALAAGGAQASNVADTDHVADASFAAFNANFLYRGEGKTYYTNTLLSKGHNRAGTWTGALDIAVAEDVYQRTHSSADRQLVSDLVTTFLAEENYDWKQDTWNDDIAWMVLTTIRGYQTVGNPAWLNQAVYGWNMAYDRGWTASIGGGGIWEDMNSLVTGDGTGSKCALSNNPMVTAALSLYQITGDDKYLAKAKGIYAWVRNNLFNATTGRIDECISFPRGATVGTLQPSDNAYNSGSFIEAANYLYRVTGDSMYYNDALLAANHTVSSAPILHDGGQRDTQWQYRFFRGLSEFCTDNNLCDKYNDYMVANAKAAWSMRDSRNLTWNDWTKPTSVDNPDAFMMTSAVAIWQQLPSNSPPGFSAGQYRIQNVASGLTIGVQNNSTSSYAPVVQATDTGDESQTWTFVPASNGHITIRNARSGQLLNVAAASGALGQKVVQWPAQGIRPSNDQWLPVQNSDGTWSFYNRNSQLALDNPGASTAAGTQLNQWAPNNTDAQKFVVTPRGGAVRSGIAGKCLDVRAADSSDGTPVGIYDCNSTAAQSWVAHSDGTLRALGKCLDAANAGTANGTKLQLYTCNGTGAQVFNAIGGTLRNPASGRCIDDPYFSAVNGTQVQLYDCMANDNAQQWSTPGI